MLDKKYGIVEDNSYRLKLNIPFTKNNGEPRTNKLTAYMVEDKMQLYIDNGRNPKAEPIYATCRLDQENMKKLMEFLQRNIK